MNCVFKQTYTYAYTYPCDYIHFQKFIGDEIEEPWLRTSWVGPAAWHRGSMMLCDAGKHIEIWGLLP